jgi:hypothetical protein
MQDRYVGDVGDFGKYALLRRICSGQDGKGVPHLAVVWCLFPNESHNNDGRHVTYLAQKDFRYLDAFVFDKLKKLVENDTRRVSAIAENRLFSQGTVFFEAHISRELNGGERFLPSERVSYRIEWLGDCLAATRNTDVVFFDPDNGFEIASVDKKHPKAGKYVYWDELREFWNRGQSLIIYHHLNRTASVYQQMEALKGRVSREISGQYRVVRLIFRRGSCRSYWFLLQNDIAELVEERVAKMMQSGWRQHFEMI